MSAVDRIEKLATTLLIDLEAVDCGPYVADSPADRQQKLQLILDAFEQVGTIALSTSSFKSDVPAIAVEVCRCNEYETCPVCIEAHRRFQEVYGASQQEQTPH